MIIISSDTTWSGRIVLKDQVQVAPGATLTLAPGAEIVAGRNSGSIQVAGSLVAHGSDSGYVRFSDIYVSAMSGYDLATFDFDRVHFIGGSLLESGTASGTGISLYLKNSILEHVDRPLAIYNNAAKGVPPIIEGNIFRHHAGVVLGWGDATVVNNVFASRVDNRPALTSAYGDASPLVQGNSFLGGNPFGVGGGKGDTFNAQGNWFGTISEAKIAGMIRDYFDDISLGLVDWSAYLGGPSAASPRFGTRLDEKLVGGPSADFLFGEKGNDTIRGGDGIDYLHGGKGRDKLTGERGKDYFVFESGDTSRHKSSADRITDFKHGTDKIDLSSYPEARWQKMAFTKGEGSGFSGMNDVVIWDIQKVGSKYHTYIMIDTDGDMRADATIDLMGRHKLTSADFIL